jgi:hypothetical protein
LVTATREEDATLLSDLLLAVHGEASHGTAPLIWDICWLTTRRHDGPLAETPQRFEMGVSNVLGLGDPILCN